jgi:hypothetical protein
MQQQKATAAFQLSLQGKRVALRESLWYSDLHGFCLVAKGMKRSTKTACAIEQQKQGR